MQQKALIAISGGVDSSVAAALTRDAGYNCLAATLLLWGDGSADARAVAQKLELDFYEYDARDTFQKEVVEPFIAAYEAGLTPNPCVVCNRTVKFGWLWDRAAELGCEKIVTGHYAQILYDEDTGRYSLRKAADRAKDQSYFLACLTQEQLSKILLPLGSLTKEQVRRLAEEMDLVTARKKDSQDICFVPDGDYVAFMRSYTGKDYAPGAFLDLSGNTVGTHSGAVCYTTGQRKGLGLAMGTPVYVCSKDMAANTVTVGPDEALYSAELFATDWNWHIPCPAEPIRANARIRYRHTEQPATIYPLEGRVVFDAPQRAITAGQTLVLYDGDTVLASATIL